ncbi:MAG: aminodeoxychorismate synthase component I [Gammaproteobacteria bacterium]
MAEPHIEEVPYQADSASRFAQWATAPWSIFLDSCAWEGERGRYDVLAAAPYITLTTQGTHTEVLGPDGLSVSRENPFALVRRALGERGPGSADVPFCGGAMGYFAYDLARQFERLPACAQADIAMPDMAVGIYDWALVVDHRERRAFLVAAHRDAQTLKQWPAIRAAALDPEGRQSRRAFRVLSPVQSNLRREDYAEAFGRIQSYIRAGDCYQVNLAQRYSARAEGDPWSAYCRLRELNPAPFSAFFKLPEGAVLSSSPERFLRVRAGAVETRPIKGTRPRGATQGEDLALAEALRTSPKDRAENLMIVDLLRNDLGKTCAIGSVQVPELFGVESYSTVHHLVSAVVGRLAAGRDALDLLAGCFPGGSITGAPKLRAMQIIEELEPHRRSVYCGTLGYISHHGDMDTNIAIRTLVSSAGWIHAWAGGGIVADSDREAEYQETLDKAQALLRLLSGASISDVGA